MSSNKYAMRRDGSGASFKARNLDTLLQRMTAQILASALSIGRPACLTVKYTNYGTLQLLDGLHSSILVWRLPFERRQFVDLPAMDQWTLPFVKVGAKIRQRCYSEVLERRLLIARVSEQGNEKTKYKAPKPRPPPQDSLAYSRFYSSFQVFWRSKDVFSPFVVEDRRTNSKSLA